MSDYIWNLFFNSLCLNQIKRKKMLKIDQKLYKEFTRMDEIWEELDSTS